MTISMTKAAGQYGVIHITGWSVFLASREATICRHRVSARAISPRWLLWSTNLLKQHETLTKHNF